MLNTAIYLLGLSQQVSTFAINFQGRPFREGISENPYLRNGLLGASVVAFSGATDFIPELNRWLQIVEMETHVRLGSFFVTRSRTDMPVLQFKVKLTSSMLIDFIGCWVIEVTCKYLFAELEPKPMVTKGRERRDLRRIEQAKLAAVNGLQLDEKKVQ